MTSDDLPGPNLPADTPPDLQGRGAPPWPARDHDRLGELWWQTGGGLSVAPPRATAAGVWTALLDGYHCHTADRRVAERLLTAEPAMTWWARAHPQFVQHAVAMLLEHRVRQFVDLGCGMPDRCSTLEILARAAHPNRRPARRPANADADPKDVRLLCLDIDPVVIDCVTTTASAPRPGLRVRMRQVDLRHPEHVFDDAADPVIEISEPVAVIASAVLQHLNDDEAHHLLTTMHRTVAPGSYLLLSHPSDPQSATPQLVDALDGYRAATGEWHLRPLSQAHSLLGSGWVPVAPGITSVGQWSPQNEDCAALRSTAGWCVVAISAPDPHEVTAGDRP